LLLAYQGFERGVATFYDLPGIPGGGNGKGVAALEQKSGRIIWAADSFKNTYSSPVLVHAGGRDQVIVLSAQRILGIDPVMARLCGYARLAQTRARRSVPPLLWDPASGILVGPLVALPTRLYVPDGGKALTCAVKKHAGESAPIQRWQVHKRRTYWII